LFKNNVEQITKKDKDIEKLNFLSKSISNHKYLSPTPVIEITKNKIENM
jgi:hypothetical protein